MFEFPNELAYSMSLMFSLLLHPEHSSFSSVAAAGNDEESQEHRVSVLFACLLLIPSGTVLMWHYVGGEGICVPDFPLNKTARIKSVRRTS